MDCDAATEKTALVMIQTGDGKSILLTFAAAAKIALTETIPAKKESCDRGALFTVNKVNVLRLHAMTLKAEQAALLASFLDNGLGFQPWMMSWIVDWCTKPVAEKACMHMLHSVTGKKRNTALKADLDDVSDALSRMLDRHQHITNDQCAPEWTAMLARMGMELTTKRCGLMLTHLQKNHQSVLMAILRAVVTAQPDLQSTLKAMEKKVSEAKNTMEYIEYSLDNARENLAATVIDLNAAKADLAATKEDMTAAVIDLNAAKEDLAATKVDLVETEAAFVKMQRRLLDLKCDTKQLGNSKYKRHKYQ